MVGNTILLKHASNVPQCATAIEELFKEAQSKLIVYQSIYFWQTRQHWFLIKNKEVSLTGSEEAGKYCDGKLKTFKSK
jgi:succinate-semialdehyde dehydrogenase/glutarate-semialdehyde dehydrogenase